MRPVLTSDKGQVSLLSRDADGLPVGAVDA
jgi:hypothetical protein